MRFCRFRIKLLNDSHSITDDDFDHLRNKHALSDRGFVGLFYTVNIVSGYNRVTVGSDLEYDYSYPEEWADSVSMAIATEDQQEIISFQCRILKISEDAL